MIPFSFDWSKRLRRFIVLVSLAASFASLSFSQTWEDVTGNIPGGIPVVNNLGPLAADDTYLYVNTGSGVARTTNGASFSQTADLEHSSWRWVKVVNGELWVGDAVSSQNSTFLWRSSNSGDTWNAASSGMPGEVDLGVTEDVTYDADAGTYWAASRFGGAYRSDDGTNWTHTRVGLPQAPLVGYSLGEFVVAKGGDAMVAMIGDGLIVGAGVFRTENDGASWSRLTEVHAGDPGNFVMMGDRILYTTSGVNTLTGGLFVSDDFGDSWTFQDQWLKTSHSLSTDGEIVFAAMEGSVYYSANDGDSWEVLEKTGLTPGWNAVAIERRGDFLYLFSSENNVGKLYRLDVSGYDFSISTQITEHPEGDTVIEGNRIELTGDAIGEGAVSYQWFKDGVAITGATSKVLTLDPIALADDGFYTFKATAAGGTAESEGTFATVKARSIGTVDDQFDLRFPPFNLAVTQDAYAVLVDSEGSLWVTGALRSSGSRLLKINPLDGEILVEVDTTAEGRSLAEDSEGKIWAGTNNAWLHRVSKAGTIDFTVDVNLGAGSGRVNEIVPFGDEGKVYIAGLFDTVGGQSTGPVALLNHDGTVDTSFTFDSATIDTTDIADIDVMEDGSVIVVTETFTTNSVRKLNSDGSVDADWWLGGKWDGLEKANVGGDANYVKVLPAGKLLVGFRSTFGTNAAVITNVSTLMRFHADGTWDSTFNPGGSGPGGEVVEISLAPDGKIVIVGDFDGYSDAEGVSSNRNVTRLLIDGTIDPYWNPGNEGNRGDVHSATFDDRGNVFIGSDHTWYNGVNLNRVLKLVGDVASLEVLGDPQPLILDLGETATFEVTAFGTTAVSYQWRKDGVDIAGASSSTLELSGLDDDDDGYYDVVVSNDSGQKTSAAARLMTISVPKFLVQPTGQAVATGDEIELSVEAIGLGDLTYQWYFEDEAIDGADSAAYMIGFASVLNAGGYHVEVTGSAGTSASVEALVSVTPYAGSLDLSFDATAGFNGAVYDLEELDDGSVIVVGGFSSYKGEAKSFLAKLDRFGVLDASWPAIAAPSFVIRSLDVDAEGKIILGGLFNGSGDWQWGMTRIGQDGAIDGAFNSGGSGFSANSAVRQVAVQEDGKILVVVDRSFNANPTYNDEVVQDLFRVNADGSIDETFNQVDTSDGPLGMELLSTGKTILYGSFTTVNGESHSRIVRINTNGTIDTTFDLDGDPSSTVYSVDEATDGKIVLGGQFASIGGTNNQFVALLNADGSIDEDFDSSNAGGSVPGGTIYAVSALLNGEILVVGNFTRWGGVTTTPYRIATIDRSGARTGFEAGSHVGFSSTPGVDAFIKSGAGYTYVAGSFGWYHDNTLEARQLARIHLESMDLVFLEQPDDQFVEAGQAATFSVEALGTTTIGYQWYKDGVAIPGATAASLEISDAQTINEGSYTVQIVNASGSVTSLTAELVILAKPIVLNGPSGRVANSGNTVSLVAEAIGAAPLSAQWFKDGSPISGATSSTLLIEGVLAEDAGRYHAVYTNNLGTASTEPVSVSVQFGVKGVDPNFTPGYFGSPSLPLVGVVPGDGYRVAGAFTGNGLSSYYAAINDDGSINSTINLQLYTGLVLAGSGVQTGDFNSHGVLIGVNGAKVFRVGTDGATDESYDTSWLSFPSLTSPSVKHLDDGTAFVVDTNFLAKINAEGSEDTTFNDGGAGPAGGDVSGIAVSNTGKLFLWGTFTSYNGISAPGMALLNTDGSLDGSFDAGVGVAGSEFTSPVLMAEFDAAGDIYIGGNFTSYKGSDVAFIFRLNADGSLDETFAPAAFGNTFSQVTGVLALGDGTLLVRGNFTTYDGATLQRVVPLDETGAKVDHALMKGLNGNILDWKLEADGSVIMVGSFFSPKNRMLRVNPTPPDLAIVAQPMSFEVDAGEYARLEVAAVGQEALAFQWKKDGVAIDGATDYYIEFDPAMVSDRGEYTVEVSNGVDTVASVAISPAITGFEPTPFTEWMTDQGASGFDDLLEEDDKDGDGMANALEYALGLDPLTPNPEAAPEAVFMRGSELGLSNDDLYLVMSVRLKSGLSGVTATPRAATSLEGLSTGSANVVKLSGPTTEGDFDVYEYRSSFGVGSAQDAAFMDLEVLVQFE